MNDIGIFILHSYDKEKLQSKTCSPVQNASNLECMKYQSQKFESGMQRIKVWFLYSTNRFTYAYFPHYFRMFMYLISLLILSIFNEFTYFK